MPTERPPATPSPPRHQRLRSLDGLRGLAALSVVLYHYGYRVSQLYPEVSGRLRVAAVGQYGVQLFFVISGFVIFMTLQRSSPRLFVLTRFIRLYPIYWVCVALTWVVVTLVGLPGRTVSFPVAMVNLTMVEQYLGLGTVDGAYWTLAAELGFYAQVGILFFAGLLQGRRLPTTLLVWVLTAAVVGQAVRLDVPHAVALLLAVLNLGLTWTPLFVAGIAAYRIWVGDRRVGVLLAPLVVVAFMLSKGDAAAVATLCVFALFGLALRSPVARLIATPPFYYLGQISYPLYLVHQNIGYVIILSLASVGLSHAAAALVAAAAVLALASLLTFGVDVPVRRWLHRRLITDGQRLHPQVQSRQAAARRLRLGQWSVSERVDRSSHD